MTDYRSTAADTLGERPIGRRRSDRIVGVSAPMQQAVDQASAAARSDAIVLIVGPPGSGKAHLGRAIHAWSGQSSGPCVSLSLPATPDSQQARELFGVGPNAEPLLSGDSDGALARAGGGTLLLSGIDALSASTREVLIQSLKNRSFRSEGAGEATPLRARVIATAAEAQAHLLGDLPVRVVRLVPLAERSEDILPLAMNFLAEFAETEGVRPVGFTSDSRRCLLDEPWDGNVRELRERVRQALRLAGDGAISVEALVLATEGDEVPSFKEAKRGFETRYVEGLLRRCGGNISRAARLAKKDRKDFYDVIRRTGVNPAEFRP